MERSRCSPTVEAATPLHLEPLSWDSGHFGFPVARLMGTVPDVEAARRSLQRARDEGVRLVYWASSPEHRVPDALLLEFSGRLVDQKVTFAVHFDHLGAEHIPGQFSCSEVP